MKREILLLTGLMLAATPALAQTKAMMQNLNDRWAEAFNKGDAATVAAMYTEDAYVLPAGAAMVKGRPAIEAMWRQNMRQIDNVKCTTIDVKPLGGSAAGRNPPFAASRRKRSCPRMMPSNTPSSGAGRAAVAADARHLNSTIGRRPRQRNGRAKAEE